MSEEEIRLIKCYFNDGYCCDLDELKEIANKMIDQLQQKENIIKDIKSQLEYIETYSSKEDVFEDMKRRLDRIESIVNRK